MLEITEISNKILLILNNDMKRDVDSVEVDLLSSGILDSLAFVDLLFALEETFSITIQIESIEIEDFRSVANAAKFIEKNLST